MLHTCFTHFSIHSDFRVIEHVQIVVVHDDRVVYYIISFDICNLFYCFMGGYPFCSDCTPSVLFCQIEFCSMYPGCVLLALFCGGYPFCSDCTLSVLFCQIEFCSMYPGCDLLALFHRTCILFFTFTCFSLNRFGPFLCCSLELVLCFIWLWPFDTVSLNYYNMFILVASCPFCFSLDYIFLWGCLSYPDLCPFSYFPSNWYLFFYTGVAPSIRIVPFLHWFFVLFFSTFIFDIFLHLNDVITIYIIIDEIVAGFCTLAAAFNTILSLP